MSHMDTMSLGHNPPTSLSTAPPHSNTSPSPFHILSFLETTASSWRSLLRCLPTLVFSFAVTTGAVSSWVPWPHHVQDLPFFPPQLLWCFRSLDMVTANASFRAEHSIDTYSESSDQLRGSSLTAALTERNVWRHSWEQSQSIGITINV